MSQFRAFILFVSLLAFGADAFSDGAGAGTCKSGLPGGDYAGPQHGKAGSGSGGFSLAFSPALPSPSTYTPCTEYEITLGGGSFIGFAISPLTPETGAMTPGINSKAFQACVDFSDGEGLTHTSADQKTAAKGTWRAPANGDASIRWTVLTRMNGRWFIQTLALSPSPTPSPAVCPGQTGGSGDHDPTKCRDAQGKLDDDCCAGSSSSGMAGFCADGFDKTVVGKCGQGNPYCEQNGCETYTCSQPVGSVHVGSKCADEHGDCCTSGWFEPQECLDGYTPVADPQCKYTSNPRCAKLRNGAGCYGCFSPQDLVSATSPKATSSSCMFTVVALAIFGAMPGILS